MVIAATAAATAIALAWTVSPLTVLALLFLLVVCRGAVRDLHGRERSRVIGVLALGVVIRVTTLVAIFLMTDPAHEQFHAIIPDARFAIQRSLMLVNLWRGDSIGPWYALVVFDPYGGHAYARGLALVQEMFGPSPAALVLISVCAFIAAVLLLFRLARRAFGPRVALVGLVILLFWPSWFVWSVSMLKESVVLLLGTVALWGGVHVINRDRVWLALALIATGMTGLIALRDGVAAIPAGGTLAGLTAALALRRSAATLTVIGACALAVTLAASRPNAQAFIATQVRAAASRHVGHVFSSGYDYRIVDQRFYSDWPEAPWTMQFDEGVRFLARASASFILVPLPWQLPPTIAFAFLPQQIAWYAVVALALPGFWWGLRRAPQLTMALAGCCVVGLVVIAPNSGNVGTLVRHRDMIMPFLVWLGAAGAVRIAEGSHAWH